MAWSDAARAAAKAARRARKQLKPGADKLTRLITLRSTIQAYRDKLWKKSTSTVRGQAQTHLVRPKWAMSARTRPKRRY